MKFILHQHLLIVSVMKTGKSEDGNIYQSRGGIWLQCQWRASPATPAPARAAPPARTRPPRRGWSAPPPPPAWRPPRPWAASPQVGVFSWLLVASSKFERKSSIISVVQRSCWSSGTAGCVLGTGNRTVCTCLTSLCNCDNCSLSGNLRSDGKKLNLHHSCHLFHIVILVLTFYGFYSLQTLFK